jgi:general secretion pathway protein B
MSYILDALRRADAERERGAVPGLHAHGLPADAPPATRDVRSLALAAGAAGALLVAVVVVLVFGPWRAQPAQAPVAAADPAPRPAAPVPAPQATPLAAGETPPARPGALAPAALPVEPPPGRTAAPAAVALDKPDAVHARAAASQAIAARAADPRVAAQAPQGRVGVVTRTAPAAVEAAAPEAASAEAAPAEHYGAPLPAAAAPARAAANAVVDINDLPPATRAALPRLAPGGAIYSDVPSARMLILNGQVWHEGERPAPDTVLEQIRHKSAVLNWRGTRYEIKF